jgi:Probable zinc-ribbon domain
MKRKNDRNIAVSAKMEVVCPVCEKKRNAKNTVLWDYFFFASGYTVKPDTPKDLKDFGQFVAQYVRFKMHRFQWACNHCIAEGMAIKGDYLKQYHGLGSPILAYTNLKRICVDCSAEFVFSAQEQQYWYEVLGFYLDSIPKKCPNCRKFVRVSKNMQKRVQALLQQDAHTVGELKELHEFYKLKGNIQKANYYQNQIKKRSAD